MKQFPPTRYNRLASHDFKMLAVRSSTLHLVRPRVAAVTRGSPEHFFSALTFFAGHSSNTRAARPRAIFSHLLEPNGSLWDV